MTMTAKQFGPIAAAGAALFLVSYGATLAFNGAAGKPGAEFDERGLTALHRAVLDDDVARIESLLMQGTPLDAGARGTGMTPLDLAAIYGRTGPLGVLLDNAPAGGVAGGILDRLLARAAIHGHYEAAGLLIGRGANVNQTTGAFSPLVWEVAHHAHDDVVGLLLEHGADPNAACPDGLTALHAAAGLGGPGVGYLLDHGANANALALDASTPLHFAARAGRIDAAFALLQRGANANAPNRLGKTPLDYARERKDGEVAALLAEHAGTPAGKEQAMPAHLAPDQARLLNSSGWAERVGADTGIWVSVGEQMTRIVQGEAILWQAPCATAANGTGAEMDSLKTPPGWHSIASKIGGGAAWGQVFRSRRPVNEAWKRGGTTAEDLVLTRVLELTGEEEGINKGGDVDSRARNIYFHGTNDEARIGTPSSHGCIRLTNDAVIEFFDRVNEGTKVLILP